MTEKKTPEPDDPAQFERFLEMADRLGAEYDADEFEEKVKAIAGQKPKAEKPLTGKKLSD